MFLSLMTKYNAKIDVFGYTVVRVCAINFVEGFAVQIVAILICRRHKSLVEIWGINPRRQKVPQGRHFINRML